MSLLRKKQKAAAVIVAAGSSTRMGGIDKLTAELCGETVISRTVAAFEQAGEISEIIIVTREDRLEEMSALVSRFTKVKKTVRGGKTRTESALAGVAAVSPRCGIILIHDAARPLVSARLISESAAAAAKYGAALPAIPVKDTVKSVSDGFVERTCDRSVMYLAQTPQAFRAELIKAALSDAVKNGAELTDDCAAAERLGMRPFVTSGDNLNIKITTPEDLLIAEAILKGRSTA
ncbi:MAG: 2-C-methyl-D-erythritol 4-phosphate cytidylyltransferase [Oscillospiraceae bacterium]|jgi:2-C-methyl-D-erythritol 4-phosphate cytidylyltransferase|nr:2-C-methyl-D-erythritol 4-phosphate cytidylyltransferase [Oscillospiraceae bacterium]